MDLAEIRKKARNGKLESGQPKPSVPPAASAPLPVPGTAPSRPGPESPGERASRDVLAELFDLPGELEVASEESYLAGLQQGAEEASQDLRQWLTFSLGSEDYALDIRQISEIIKPREVTEIPRAPDFVLGVISLRGIIVPIFDLGLRLRLKPSAPGPAARIIVCHAEGRSAGLLVDRISQVVRLAESSLEPPPAVLSGLDRDLVGGVGRHLERMLILLHLPSVLNAELV